MDRFGLDDEAAKRDVDGFLGDLTTHGLIHRHDSAAARAR
jgi:hypothetical protein